MFIGGLDYTFSECCRLLVNTIRSRIFFPGALIIRFPFYIRSKNCIKLGKGFACGYGCRFEAIKTSKSDNSLKISFGDNCHIGDFVHIAAAESVFVGSNCLFASNIFITDLSHGVYSGNKNHSMPASNPNDRPIVSMPTFIGDNVWIGENVTVLSGTKIGNGCVIGAHSVVTKDIPDNSIAVGNPARVIKHYNIVSEKWEKVNE